MADDKIIRCDCGYRVRARTEQRQVAEVRRHAWEAHGISFSTEAALAVLLRRELELDERESTLAVVDDTTDGKEEG
jgi:Protein of unknown function (DUF1059)